MINNLIQRAKSTFSQPISQPEPVSEPALETIPSPIPEPAPAPAPAVQPKPIDASPKALALRAAEAAGLVVGEWYSNLKLCRHQIANHPTYLWAEGVPQAGWHARIIVSVKNPQSWKPVNPPHDTLSARFTGTAQVDGTLKFESQDICRAARYRRSGR